jgi:hypothetical protein
LASDSFLPVADTASDPGFLHAEGLAYLSESGFPANWDHQAGVSNVANVANVSNRSSDASMSDAGRDNLDEYFDSAPVAGLGEPAPVTTLAPLPEKNS